MKALVWHKPTDIRCDEVPDPKIEQPRDAIIRVTTCAPSAAPTCISTTATCRA